MRRSVRRVLVLSSVLAAGLAGCGGSGKDLLSERSAASLAEQVDRVEAAMSREPLKCENARKAAEAGRRRAQALPARVDEELKSNLVAWFEHLGNETRKECNRQRPKKTPTPEPTAEPTETATPDPTASPAPSPDPTKTATPEPTAEPTAEPPDNGGVDAGGAEPE